MDPHRLTGASEPEVPPLEDARYPIYQAIVEREWKKWRPSLVKTLEKDGSLQKQIDDTALMCVTLLQEYQRCGLGPDMGREAAHSLIIPSDEK